MRRTVRFLIDVAMGVSVAFVLAHIFGWWAL